MATDPMFDLANAIASATGGPVDDKTLRAQQKWTAGQIAARVKTGLSKSDAVRKLTKDIIQVDEKRVDLIADPFLKRNEALEDLEKTLAGARTRARGNSIAEYKFEATEIHKKQKDLRGKMKKLHKETATGDPDYQAKVEASPTYQQGNRGRAQSVLENFMTADPFAGQPKGYRGQTNFPATTKAMLETFNREMEYEVFKFDNAGVLTNIDELFGDQGRSGQTENPGKLPEVMGLNDSGYFKNFRSGMEYYNERQKDNNELSAELEAADTAADAALVNLNSAKTLKQIKDTNEKYQVGAVSGLSTFYEKLAEGMPAEYIDATKKQLGRLDLGKADLETELASAKRGGQAGAVSGGGGGAQSNRVRGFSNEAWLDWARDNGFDNLGYVTNGRYVEGADDDKAVILFNRQKRADPGSFRFRAARTGETVQVELKDGTRVFGERLRRHAADRGRVIRVATKDGLQEFRPGDIDRVVVLPSDGKRPQRGFSLDPDIGRRAGRIGRRRADDIDSAVGQAMPRDIGEMIGTAVTRSGDYALDEDGKYVKQEAFDAAQDKHFADKSLTVRMVKGVAYFADGQDNVYSPAEDGSLTLIDPEGSKGNALTVGLARGAKPLRLMELTGEEARLMTMDDIVSGKLPAEFEWEGDGTEDEARAYDKLAQTFRNSISPEALGFKSTSDRPDPFAGQTVTNERVISGVTFVDLAGDEDAPDAELPEDPTAIEQADADELIDAYVQRRGTEAVYGGKEGKEISDRYDRVDASLKKLEDPSLTDEGREADLAKLLSGAVGGAPMSGELQERLRQIGIESTKGLSPVTYPGFIESGLAPLSEAHRREEVSAAAKGVAEDQESRKDAIRKASAAALWRDVPRQSQQSIEEEKEDEAGAAYLEDVAKAGVGTVNAAIAPGEGGLPYRYQSALALSARRKAEDLESSPEAPGESP